jgi:YHS domain-containing protein
MRKSITALLVLAAALAAMGCGKGKEAPSPAPNTTLGEERVDSVNTERDPVCGMYVDPKKALKSEFEGKTYYFCSAEDKAKFDKEPDKYISQAP